MWKLKKWICLSCPICLQLHISPPERRSKTGGLHRLSRWLFLSPLSHCQPKCVWSRQLLCKAPSLTQSTVSGQLGEPAETRAVVLVLSFQKLCNCPIFRLFSTYSDVILHYLPLMCICDVWQRISPS